jgi:isoleucyl-tRNA synthetase
MLAPILSFTADEAWDHVSGKEADSVHLMTWQPLVFALSNAEEKIWEELFEIREAALTELEKARQSKLIGKALDAQVEVKVASSKRATLENRVELLRELLNVSQLRLTRAETSGENAAPPRISVSKAEGQKCERCWHWETDIGSHPNHPTICGRCVKAIEQNRAEGVSA